MKPLLRTVWSLLSAPAMLVLACAFTSMWLTAPSHEFMRENLGPGRIFLKALMAFSFMGGLAMVAIRIAQVIEAGVWRLLPGGYRTVIRATGLIMLAIMLLGGLVNVSSTPNRLSHVPFGGRLADTIFFTLLSLPLLAGIGHRQSRLVIVAYLIGCLVALQYLIGAFAQVPAFWYATAGLCVAAWLYGSFGNLQYPRAGSWWRRLHEIPAIPGLAFARFRLPFAPVSPACELLRSRRGVRNGLPFAALIILAWAGFQFLTVNNTRDKFLFGYPVVLGITLFLLVSLSQDVGAAARRLWLRWGDSRAELFRLAERMLLRDAAILCTLAWGAVTLFASLSGPSIDTPSALKMLAAHLVAGLAPIYLALAFSTINVGWQRVVCAALCVGAVTLLGTRWLDAFGYEKRMIDRIDAELLLLLIFILLVLRAFASWRWRTIDWTYFRQARRKT